MFNLIALTRKHFQIFISNYFFLISTLIVRLQQLLQQGLLKNVKRREEKRRDLNEKLNKIILIIIEVKINIFGKSCLQLDCKGVYKCISEIFVYVFKENQTKIIIFLKF